eukprot:CAMPEP_0171374778 /NCGR_PEP_ID=MMETSP0879-20121228/15441_1 /TAXON_ID=67004 /ORGANISM="Thalassiosira weissflogii, Strain CCMP1336" /LENGTH=187 /DNA_ID=CAMNT_0011884209 /DNA_START=504 /DNA_END=1067 /DNA_ORIENTATION=+
MVGVGFLGHNRVNLGVVGISVVAEEDHTAEVDIVALYDLEEAFGAGPDDVDSFDAVVADFVFAADAAAGFLHTYQALLAGDLAAKKVLLEVAGRPDHSGQSHCPRYRLRHLHFETDNCTVVTGPTGAANAVDFEGCYMGNSADLVPAPGDENFAALAAPRPNCNHHHRRNRHILPEAVEILHSIHQI